MIESESLTIRLVFLMNPGEIRQEDRVRRATQDRQKDMLGEGLEAFVGGVFDLRVGIMSEHEEDRGEFERLKRQSPTGSHQTSLYRGITARVFLCVGRESQFDLLRSW
jgi:hypothetical protein